MSTNIISRDYKTRKSIFVLFFFFFSLALRTHSSGNEFRFIGYTEHGTRAMKSIASFERGNNEIK